MAPPKKKKAKHDAPSKIVQSVDMELTSSGPKLKVGMLLELFRAQKGLSTRKLAHEAKVSYTLISGIENGKRPLTDNVLQKIARPLGLTPNQEQGLREAAQEPNPALIVSAHYVSAATLFERESQPDIGEVWVIDPSPAELHAANWLEKVSVSINKDGKRYIYFLPTADDATGLRAVLSKKISAAKVDELVSFIIVPSSLHVFVFNPAKVFWRSKLERHLGVWAFYGPKGSGSMVDGGFRMDDPTHNSFVNRLQGIISHLEVASTYASSDTVWTAPTRSNSPAQIR